MGSGSEYKCSKCGYEFNSFVGVGMMFPQVYEEKVEKAKKGELGPEIQAFFAENKDGAINAEGVFLCCDECGALKNGTDLTMYVKNPDKVKENAGNYHPDYFLYEHTYYMEDELKDFFDEYSKYPHICEKCGGNMHIIDYDEPLMCPKCRIPLENSGFIMWD